MRRLDRVGLTSERHGRARYGRRLVGMASPTLREGDKSLLAVQVAETDGPFAHPQEFQQGALGKYDTKSGPVA